MRPRTGAEQPTVVYHSRARARGFHKDVGQRSAYVKTNEVLLADMLTKPKWMLGFSSCRPVQPGRQVGKLR